MCFGLLPRSKAMGARLKGNLSRSMTTGATCEHELDKN